MFLLVLSCMEAAVWPRELHRHLLQCRVTFCVGPAHHQPLSVCVGPVHHKWLPGCAANAYHQQQPELLTLVRAITAHLWHDGYPVTVTISSPAASLPPGGCLAAALQA